MTESEPEWMLLEEAMDMLGIGRKSVMWLYREGILTERRKFADTWCFLRSEVMYRKAHPKRAYWRGTKPRCTVCGYLADTRGMCPTCYWHGMRGYAAETEVQWDEPRWAWAAGTFEIVNPAFHGVGG